MHKILKTFCDLFISRGGHKFNLLFSFRNKTINLDNIHKHVPGHYRSSQLTGFISEASQKPDGQSFQIEELGYK